MGRAPTHRLTEEQFQQQIIDLARMAGWKAYHTRDSRRSVPGFPDLVLVNPRRRLLLFVECKTDDGRLSTEQKEWLSAIDEATTGNSRVRVQVWRPNMWDEVRDILAPQPTL